MRRYLPFLLIFFLLVAAMVRADETISASGFTWNKPDITILPGEVITWTWAGTHTSTSTDTNNCVAGGTDPWNFTTSGHTKTLTAVNNYFYMCAIHCGMGMKGVIRLVDFNLSCSPSTVPAAQAGSGTSTCTITSVNGLTLPVTFSTTGLPAGVTAGFSTNPVTPPANGTIDSTLTLNVGGTVTPGSYPFTVSAMATSASSTPKMRTKTFSMTLTVTAGPDFTIDCNPSSWVMTVDGSDTNTCTIHSAGGFSNTVNLGCSGNPAGSSCTFSVNPVTPPPNGSTTTDVTVDAQSVAAAGSYNLQISGTGTPGTRMFNGTVVVQDFTVSANQTALISPPGGSANTTATVTSLQGFNNAVNLACSGLPAGATCGFAPTPVTPPANSSANSAVTVNVNGTVPEASYPFQITGTSGTVVRSQNMSLLVTTAQDFSIGCAPSTPSGSHGGSAQSTCTIGSINAYTGSATLSCSGLPTGVTCSFAPNPVSPPNGGSADSVLTLNIDNTVAIGSYPFQVNGVDGPLNHSANLTLSIAPDYADYFDDTDVSDWTFKKGTWSSPAGALIGTWQKKATAMAPYTMPTNSTVEADLQTTGGQGQVSLFGWYVNSKTNVELQMTQNSGRWILKQKINGARVAKAKFSATINPGTTYHAVLSYDGTSLNVSIDGVSIISVIATPPPPGSPGFKVKATTGTFGEILSYQ